MEHKTKTVAQKGIKKVGQQTSGNTDQIFVLVCGSTSGQALYCPSNFSGKRFSYDAAEEIPGTFCGKFDSGLMDQYIATFLSGSPHTSHFLKHAVPELVDFYSLFSMVTPLSTHLELIQTASEKNVYYNHVLFASTHYSQHLNSDHHTTDSLL